MSTRWESIVRTARQIDESFAGGAMPESAVVMGLARAVLEFQQHLAGIRHASLKVPTVIGGPFPQGPRLPPRV